MSGGWDIPSPWVGHGGHSVWWPCTIGPWPCTWIPDDGCVYHMSGQLHNTGQMTLNRPNQPPDPLDQPLIPCFEFCVANLPPTLQFPGLWPQQCPVGCQAPGKLGNIITEFEAAMAGRPFGPGGCWAHAGPEGIMAFAGNRAYTGGKTECQGKSHGSLSNTLSNLSSLFQMWGRTYPWDPDTGRVTSLAAMTRSESAGTTTERQPGRVSNRKVLTHGTMNCCPNCWCA